jgi:cytochrome b involved in lipid metabolism
MTVSVISLAPSEGDSSGGPFNTIMGLPVHPLIVHASVVLLPLSALGLLTLIVVPKWRKSPLDWLVMLGLVAGAGATFVAKESGEALAAEVGNPKTHSQLGDVMPLFAFGLLVLGLVWFFLEKAAARRGSGRSTLANVVAVLCVLAIGLNLVWIFRVGHSGAEAVWAGRLDTTGSTATPAKGTSGAKSGTYSLAQVKTHNTEADCWAVIDGTVYDVSGYATKHPGGPSHIDKMCGTDATDYFRGQHGSQGRPNSILKSLAIGTLAGSGATAASNAAAATGPSGSYTMTDVKAHSTASDCWTAISGKVYDVSGYQDKHPGGAKHIENLCGTDGTAYFGDEHGTQGRPNSILAGFQIGTLQG